MGRGTGELRTDSAGGGVVTAALMGGGGASPCGAGMLQFESAGLGWPPNVRTPCAGLPRRLLRGECAGALRMAEADPAAARDMPEFALPDPKGEGIKQYIQRDVAYDDTFKGLAGHARYLGVEVALPGVCHPAFLTPDAVQAYYQAFDRLNQDPRAEGFWDLINHLWFGQHHLPFAVRMAQTSNPDVGEVFWTEEDKPRSWTDMLRSVRRAAHRRDSLVAGIFDALRSGRWQASGFIPGDHMRQPVPIIAPWWADDQIQCNWMRGELCPQKAATPGRPTFLGVTLAVASNEHPFCPQDGGVEPALQTTRKTHTTADEDACAAWLIEQWPLNPTMKKPAWNLLAKQHPRWRLLSELGFNRAWVVAARMHSGMVKGGRPQKLPR